jgi:hypothetical protein
VSTIPYLAARARAIIERYDAIESDDDPGYHQRVDAAIDLIEPARELVEAVGAGPQFAPEGEPDIYRDLWEANMPRGSGCMYFAIPGEQPIHVTDEQARYILAYLSEGERS